MSTADGNSCSGAPILGSTSTFLGLNRLTDGNMTSGSRGLSPSKPDYSKNDTSHQNEQYCERDHKRSLRKYYPALVDANSDSVEFN